MIGGVVTSTLMELLVYPAIFFLWRARRFTKELGTGSEHVEALPATA
jgi:Cu(I)/Ag(I) efflux system membrane protein CusA/SilA